MKDASRSGGERFVFVLGDSRTGTTTLHRFLKRAGYSSIHYFFKESGVSEPAHSDLERNWTKLRAFIDAGEYDAFSDYPLRTFYRQLISVYPKARYILTTRKDEETWRRSMVGFFKKFDLKIDIEALTEAYTKVNEDIRKRTAALGIPLCEVCIDDDPVENGRKLSEFLDLPEALELGWENATKSYDNSLISSRATFYNTKAEDFVGYVEGMLKPSKAMLSEFGWVYLVNDSSDFLRYLYGFKGWSDAEAERVLATLAERRDAIAAMGAGYLKVMVPEKSVVYPQFLPRVFHDHPISEDRPAPRIAAALPDFASYPIDLLKDVRSYGLVYFRGDSHTNWLGAYFLYFHIVERLAAAKLGRGRGPIPLSTLQPSLASYRGDLFTQLDADYASIFDGAWKDVNLGERFEYLVRYVLPEEARRARPEPVGDDLIALLGERETFRFRHEDNTLPKAVVFRDSTVDFIVELLAEHFSECLFVWHKGNVYEDIIALEKPDVVLHIMAERFVNTYPQRSALDRLGLDALPEANLAGVIARKVRAGKKVEDIDLFGPVVQVSGGGISNAGRPRQTQRVRTEVARAEAQLALLKELWLEDGPLERL